MLYIVLFLTGFISATICMYWAKRSGRDPVTWFAIGFLLNGFTFLVIRECVRTARLATRA